MVDFISWLVESFRDFINVISYSTVDLINSTFHTHGKNVLGLEELEINLVLLSDTPILSTNVFDLLLLVFSIFYTVVFVVIVYKIIKKVLVTITRWNRW